MQGDRGGAGRLRGRARKLLRGAAGRQEEREQGDEEEELGDAEEGEGDRRSGETERRSVNQFSAYL